ncbi:hypothetical protein FHR75_004350 [Kineococcus radiotolerans]|uniref:DUF3298 domain-containing protein n=1 Tax=Kineococcus radiotolerans TaxID=131568 RepID=A0A7W4TRQ8_KINRA|nr:hypothetical protein [Kineococcus radiotolerans]MBB2903508.1 hypothetical protein [Kineococcus radiotolerans]
MSASRPVVRRAAALLAVTAVGLTACGADRTTPAAAGDATVPSASSSPPATPVATPPGSTASPASAALPWTETRLTGTAGSLTWDVVLPRFTGAPVADEVNRRVVASAEDAVAAARASVQDGDPPRTITGRGVVTTNDGRTAQVLLEVVDSTEGTAHPTTTLASTVVDVRRGRPVTLDALFTDPPAALADLAPVVADLAVARGEPVTAPEGLAPEVGNWATWQSGPDGLVFSFQDYQLGGHGTRSYVVPWVEAEALLTDEARELLVPR